MSEQLDDLATMRASETTGPGSDLRSAARILVADDDPASLDLLTQFFRLHGYLVSRAGDGGDAWAALCAGGIDVVVTDNHMPVMTGLDLVARSQSLPRSVPFILMSGAWTHEELEMARRLRCARVYAKPVDLDDLLRVVRSIETRVPTA